MERNKLILVVILVLTISMILITLVSCRTSTPIADELDEKKEIEEELSDTMNSDDLERNYDDLTEEKISIIPVDFYESSEFIDPPFESETYDQQTIEYKTEPGWKYVSINLGLKNDTKEFIDINNVPFFENKEEIKITTKQGWSYSYPESGDSFFPLMGDRFQDALYLIPNNFTIIGSYFHFNSIGYYYLRFKVAEKSSDYKLILPGYPEINLNEINKNIILPTDLENSSFFNLGDNLSIDDKGSLVVGYFKRNPISNEVTVYAIISNSSEGYSQIFNLYFFVIGNDGILRASQSFKNIFTSSQIEVGPGQNYLIEELFDIDKQLENPKLIISGDIGVVINSTQQMVSPAAPDIEYVKEKIKQFYNNKSEYAGYYVIDSIEKIILESISQTEVIADVLYNYKYPSGEDIIDEYQRKFLLIYINSNWEVVKMADV